MTAKLNKIWGKFAKLIEETIMKTLFLPAVIILLGVSVNCPAGDKELGVAFELDYRSQWLNKGMAVYGKNGGFFKAVFIDFYGTGFGLELKHRNATGSGYVDQQRFDYRPFYRGVAFDDKTYATNYFLSLGYEHYPGLARNTGNTTFEWIFAFSWPKIMPDGFIPRYIVHYEYPAGSGYDNSQVAGWVHRFGLDYDLQAEWMSGPVRLSSELGYTDGLASAEHDWSYLTIGISKKFNISDRLTFTPGIYHQFSMDDSVLSRDVTYCRLKLRYRF